MKSKLSLLLFLPAALCAQHRLVMIHEQPGIMGPCEPSVAVSPANPDHLMAGAILNVWYSSKDGGETWERGRLKSEYGVWGDPCLVADAEGSFYYFHLSDPTGRNWFSKEILDRIVCQRTDDLGKSWKVDSYMGEAHPKDQDKEWAAVDLNNGRIYCTWTQFDKYGSDSARHKSNILFSYSENRGKKWSKPVQINALSGGCLDDDNTTEGAVPAVGPNGEVYVAWAHAEKIWFTSSKDGGLTWPEENILVTDQPGGWETDIPGIDRSNGMPVTAADVSSGPYRGTVYVNWTDNRYGNQDAFVARSTDGGVTWSPPVRVNNDSTKTDQFFTWMTVDPANGNIYTVFYDRRGMEGNKTHVTLAWSSDGGETWTNERLTDKPFEPVKEVFFGDYTNISAYNGVVRPVWTQYAEGKLSIWTALINHKDQ